MTFDRHLSGARRFASFPITEFLPIKRQMLSWASRFGIFCFLDSQGYQSRIEPGLDCLLAVGAVDRLELPAGDAFSRLKAWSKERREWVFGHFAYDLAAETEPPPNGRKRDAKPDPLGFPDLFLFIPEILVQLGPTLIRIGCLGGDPEAIWRQILATDPEPETPASDPDRAAWALIPPFKARLDRSEYLARVNELRRDILRGDCYEVNFCQEFASEPAELDPLAAWWSLSRASPNPFSCLYRLDDRYLLCASPERYLKRAGDRLYSQPIKGTAPRYPGRPAADEAARDQLAASAKDRSENVMVVDLVRNDLSRVCKPGSVKVEELCGIYAFPQVFQMISTVSGSLNPGLEWPDAIAATFPMGSMTGAPKNRVVGLIDRYEPQKRGIFSGAVGYVTPAGDFDFNVVIRSLLYHGANRYLSYQVGSGITFYSDPAAEYEECLVKAGGILKALHGG